MNAQDLASLTQAAFDLKLVQSVLGAMHRADLASGKIGPVAFIGPGVDARAACCDRHRFDCFEHDRRECCEHECCEARKHSCPAPVYQRPKVVLPAPIKVESEPIVPAPAEGARETSLSHKKLTLDPPWANVPWKNPPPPVVVIKQTIVVHDKDVRGNMIDLFI